MALSRWVRRQSWLLTSRTLASTEHTVLVFLSALPTACLWKAVSVSQPGMDLSKEEFAPKCSMACCPCLPLSWHCWDGALQLPGSTTVPNAVFATWVHLQLHSDSAASHRFTLHLNACTHRMALCALYAVLPFPLRMIQVRPRRFDEAGHGDVSPALMEMISCHPQEVPTLCFCFKLRIFTKHTPLKGYIGFCCIFCCGMSLDKLMESCCKGSLGLSKRRK